MKTGFKEILSGKAVLFAVVITSFSSAAVSDHFNTRNLLDICKEDASFNGNCFTYIAAYKDLLGFFGSSSPEERIALFCLLDVPTNEISAALQSFQLRPNDHSRIADFLIAEFCNG